MNAIRCVLFVLSLCPSAQSFDIIFLLDFAFKKTSEDNLEKKSSVAGQTPLHAAALNNQVTAVLHLLRAGSLADATMVDGTTALMLAKEVGHDRIAKILQEWKAKAEAKARAKGKAKAKAKAKAKTKAKTKAKGKAKAKAKAKVSQKRMKTKATVKIAKTESITKRPAKKTRV